MRSIFRLAFRSLAFRSGGPARFTAAAGLFGIALAVAGLIIALALTRGYQDELRSKLLAETPHIIVTANDGGPIDDWLAIKPKVTHAVGTADITGSTAVPAIIIGETTTAYALITVKHNGAADHAAGVAVGSELAKRLGLAPGDDAEAVVSAADGDARRVRLRITSIFASGLYYTDSMVIRVSPEEFAAISGIQNVTPDELHITLRDPFQAASAADSIRTAIGGEYSIVEWQEANRALFSALDLERRLAFGLIALIAVIAASSVSSSIAIWVTERRGDIAVLRACGANAATIRIIFLLQSGFIGVIGSATGIAVGLFACWAVNTFELATVSAELYMISRITLAPTLVEVAFAAMLMLMVTILAGIYPSILASREKPMEDLRRHLQ
ncbi:lipoprotein-releasing ABC transporter permease subunit [soil metagenome]